MPEGTPDHDGDEDGGMPEDQEESCPQSTNVLRMPKESLPNE